MGDPSRLRQVLLNLVGNAIKFTSAGHVTVDVDTVPVDNPRVAQMLRFRVSDTGIGIAAEDLDKLFKDFSQIDGSITRRFGGTGLGLAISSKLAENLGGEISVQSKLGESSTFTILIPLTPVAQPAAAPVADAQPKIPFSGLDILLAEDSPTNTLVATRLLQKLGHRVTAVVDGVEAIDALSRQKFDAVLMDVMMPRMDGLTATRLIRRSGQPYAKVPIIALTAAALSEDRDEAFAAGINRFATKPVSSDRLRSALEDVVAEASAMKEAG
jgi:CheY-like chemotaxis protein